MKLLFDENFEKTVVDHFRSQGYDIVYIGEDESGTHDELIIQKAFQEERIIVTNDLDFGYLVFGSKRRHAGVVLFRLPGQKIEAKMRTLDFLFKHYHHQLSDSFTVIDRRGIRIRKT